MNTQVRLRSSTSLFRLAGRVNNELVGSMRNTERMIRELFAIFTGQFDSRHKVETQSFLKCLTLCLFPEDVHFASSTTLSAQATACRIAESFEACHVITCQSNLPFCVDKEKENPAKPYRGLPQASHGINI